MPRSITATEIKANVRKMLKAYGYKLNDQNAPHWMNDSASKMAIGEAMAYLTSERYTTTERTKRAIKNWCTDIKYY